MSLKPLKSDQKHFWMCPEMHRDALGAKRANLVLKSNRNEPKTFSNPTRSTFGGAQGKKNKFNT